MVKNPNIKYYTQRFDITGATLTEQVTKITLPKEFPQVTGFCVISNGDTDATILVRDSDRAIIESVHQLLVTPGTEVATDSRFLTMSYEHLGKQIEFVLTRFASSSNYTVWIHFRLSK